MALVRFHLRKAEGVVEALVYIYTRIGIPEEITSNQGDAICAKASWHKGLTSSQYHPMYITVCKKVAPSRAC